MAHTHIALNVWVGGGSACNKLGRYFPRVIHIWRERDREHGWLCDQVSGGAPKGLAVQWREFSPLAELTIPYRDLMAYAAGPDKLLIHCDAGRCRSLTLAVGCLIVRGMEPYDAVAAVARATMWAYGHFPAFEPRTLAAICDGSALKSEPSNDGGAAAVITPEGGELVADPDETIVLTADKRQSA